MDQHHGHVHGHGAGQDADGRWLVAAGALIVAFMCGEVVAGVIAHSLALLSDAAHMLTDAASIALALAAHERDDQRARRDEPAAVRVLAGAVPVHVPMMLIHPTSLFAPVPALVRPEALSGASSVPGRPGVKNP